MSKTKEQVRQRVGEDLGIVPVGQDLESQDQTRIDAAYDEMYAFLQEKGLASWAADGDIPDRVVPWLALLLAQKLLISYSVPESRNVRISAEAGINGATALAKIGEMTVQEYDSTDSDADY